MSKIVIIGAGHVGSMCALNLAQIGICDEIVLIDIVEGKADFKPFGGIDNIYCLDIDGFNADFNDKDYVEQLKARMIDRINFLTNNETAKGGFDKLPEEAKAAIEKVASQIK